MDESEFPTWLRNPLSSRPITHSMDREPEHEMKMKAEDGLVNSLEAFEDNVTAYALFASEATDTDAD